MIINKNTFISGVVLLVAVGYLVFYFSNKNVGTSGVNDSELTTSDVPRTSDVQTSPIVSPSPKLTATKVPLPTGDGRTTFINEKVPWNLLLSDAACELKGELKFLNANIYDNQDALFTYSGIDHPARNIKWSVMPNDGSLSIGPNIFSKIQIPYGQSLIGVSQKAQPTAKNYELTASIEYGRLVDKNGKFVAVGGDLKIFQKQCQGKTTVVFP